MLWVVYGLPDVSLQILVVTINLSGCLIELIYISIYLVYAPKKTQVLHSKKVMTMFKLLFNLLFIWVTHRSTIKLQELTTNSHWNNAHYQLLWSDAILMSIVADKSFKAPGSNDGFFHFGCRHRPRICPWQTPMQAHHRRFLCCVFSWDVCISAHGHGRSSLLHSLTHPISSKWIGVISTWEIHNGLFWSLQFSTTYIRKRFKKPHSCSTPLIRFNQIYIKSCSIETIAHIHYHLQHS